LSPSPLRARNHQVPITPGTTRGFCARRSSTLTCEGALALHIDVGAFDEAAELTPKGAFFADERLPWLRRLAASAAA